MRSSISGSNRHSYRRSSPLFRHPPGGQMPHPRRRSVPPADHRQQALAAQPCRTVLVEFLERDAAVAALVHQQKTTVSLLLWHVLEPKVVQVLCSMAKNAAHTPATRTRTRTDVPVSARTRHGHGCSASAHLGTGHNRGSRGAGGQSAQIGPGGALRGWFPAPGPQRATIDAPRRPAWWSANVPSRPTWHRRHACVPRATPFEEKRCRCVR